MNQRNSYCNSGASAYNGNAPGPSKRIITGGFLQEHHQCREAQ